MSSYPRLLRWLMICHLKVSLWNQRGVGKTDIKIFHPLLRKTFTIQSFNALPCHFRESKQYLSGNPFRLKNIIQPIKSNPLYNDNDTCQAFQIRTTRILYSQNHQVALKLFNCNTEAGLAIPEESSSRAERLIAFAIKSQYGKTRFSNRNVRNYNVV